MATILRTYNDLGVKYDLDVYNEQQFLLDISAIESGDIGKVFGISSQTFALPPTPNNNEYFGNLFDLGATYPSGSLTSLSSAPTTFTKTQPCQVLNDGISIFTGKLYLDSVITDEDGDTIYNVNVVNETIDFKYLIADTTFGDLDWSNYDHSFSYANISQSWDLNLFGGDIVYPLVEYGWDADDTTATQLSNGGAPKTFTNGASPLLVKDFKPAIRINAILDKLFDSLDYKYTSSFFESAYTDTIYMLATKDTTRGTSFVNPISQNFIAYNQIDQLIPIFTATTVEFNEEVYDNASNFDTSTFKFTATEAGQYSFDFLGTSNVNGYGFSPIRYATIDLYINGIPSGVPTVVYNLTGLGSSGVVVLLQANFANISLNINDTAEIVIVFETDDAGESLRLAGGQTSTYFKCYQSPTTIENGTVNISGIFNSEEKILDFLNGLIQKFNLVIEPLRDNPKVLSIEPFNTWVDNGITVDWTDKVDRSVKWEIRHPMANHPNKIIFSDVEDKDEMNQYSVRTLDKIFGSYVYQSESDLADGEKKIGTYFAPTPMKYILNSTNFIVPQIYVADNGQAKRLVFKPRLLHYLGKKDAYLNGTKDGLPTFNTWYFKDESGTIHNQTRYPQFHHLSHLPASINNSPQARDLHFNNPQHWEYHMPEVDARTQRDAVYEYWSFYINELYDIDARLLTLNVDIKPTDIPNITLNDKIFIDGHYYRINKIFGANLTNEQSTKVELIKTLPRKLRYPRRRIIDSIGANNLPVYKDIYAGGVYGGDIISGSLSGSYAGSINNGGVVYYGYDDNQVYVEGIQVVEAANRDGFYPYSGSVVFDTVEQPIPTTNRVYGINHVDKRSTNVNIIGNGNEILGSVSNATIQGNNNVVTFGTDNIHLFGNNITTTGSVSSAFVINTETGSVSLDNVSNVIALNPTEPITAATFAGVGNQGVVVGNLQIQGNQFFTSDIITGSSGGSIYITGSHLEHYVHYFAWSGTNGSFSCFLEDANLVDGIQLRFMTNADFIGSKDINLIPSGSQTIDGDPEYPLTTPYSSATLFALGGEWLVLERKI